MKFKELGLSEPILKAITKQKYVEATKIQEIAIPHILNDKDIIGIAQTGTGKTAAFALPILEKLVKNSRADKNIKVLILSPTRELAIQIRDNIRDFSCETKFKCSVILGGVNQKSQIEVLKKGVDILVATPGRLKDLMKRNFVNLSNISYLVLDEADTMLDMGFINDVRQIVTNVPKNRQTLLFSATMSNDITKLTKEFLKNPVIVKAGEESTTVAKINQLLYMVDKKNKFNLLFDLLKTENIKTALIFTRTKHGANKLEELFAERNLLCSVIHGNKSQQKRVRGLADFKSGKTNILIATDIAARGIDIPALSHVINYDIPDHPEVYVHRIGRTGRAGLEGTSISFCCIDEMNQLKGIEKLIKQSIKKVAHNYPMMVLKPTPKRDNNRQQNRNKSNNKFDSNKKNKFDSNKENKFKKSNYKKDFKSKKFEDKSNFKNKKSK